MGNKKIETMEVTVMLIPIVSIMSIVVTIIFLRKFSNDERMALIEKGSDANIFNRKINAYPNLRYGLLLVGAGIGILVGNILAESGVIDDEAAVFSMLMIFGGAGLFASYFIEKRAAEKEAKKEK